MFSDLVVTLAKGLVADVLMVWNVAPPFVIGTAGGFRRLRGGGGADRRCGGDTGGGVSLRLFPSGWVVNPALVLEDAMGESR